MLSFAYAGECGFIVTRRVSEGLRQLVADRRPSLTRRVVMLSLAYAWGCDCRPSLTRGGVVVPIVTRRVSEGLRAGSLHTGVPRLRVGL
jgi:hypothetical protein